MSKPVRDTHESESPPIRVGPPERRSERLRSIAGTNVIAIVSLVGVVAYFGATQSQRSFYDTFGLEPEDVGLTYAETLARTGVGLLFWVLVVALGAPLVLLTWSVTFGSRRSTTPPKWMKISRGGVVVTLLSFAFVLFCAFVFILPSSYERQAAAVKKGEVPTASIWGFLDNPIRIRVERVRVRWIDEMDAAAYSFDGKTIMYLGHANGVAVFYDVTDKRTVHVPGSASAPRETWQTR